MNKNSAILIVVLFLLPSLVLAQVKLAALFTDNLILQQQARNRVWGWAAPGETVSIIASWDKKKQEVKVDAHGKWVAWLQTPAAGGGPFTITVSDGKPVTLHNVLIGEVWLCAGQSNMEMPMKGFKGQPVINGNEAILRSSNSNLRIYTVPRSSQLTPQDTSKTSIWQEADPESVSNFSATAYYFGKEIQELMHVPVGLINVSYGGSPVESWMSAQSLASFSDIHVPAKTDTIRAPNRTPTTLYNAMLYPVIGYGIKGMIWYQGESNYDRPDQYEMLFPAAVDQWRTEWKSDFPFYFVQIAPYNYAQLPPYNTGGKFNSAYLRDAQRKSLNKIPNSGMAVLMDIGEESNIHPARKKEGGQRLALQALAKTYGYKGFGFESPGFDTLVISGSIAEVKFRNAANWLTSYGKELTQFEVAGKDKIFYPAKAVINRSSVMVTSPQVKDPVAVRYAFRDFVVGELFSTEGLPVSSFRTDSW